MCKMFNGDTRLITNLALCVPTHTHRQIVLSHSQIKQLFCPAATKEQEVLVNQLETFEALKMGDYI